MLADLSTSFTFIAYKLNNATEFIRKLARRYSYDVTTVRIDFSLKT